MRLTKFNPETGLYEYKETAKTQAEFMAQRKAVIQRLGVYEDNAEAVRGIKADTALKVIDAVKSRGTRNAYSCMISGELHETYTISGKALDEIVKDSREW